MPAMMKAIVLERFGEPSEVLQVREVPVPKPGPGEVLVRMIASPINPSDLLMVRGRYVVLPSLPATPGFEGVGVVTEAGPGLLGPWVKGKRVVAINDKGGNWAEYAVIKARQARPVADDIPDEQAASLFVNPMTALGFTETMKLEGYTGIVHAAAASNLGQMLVKICLEDGIPLVNIVRSAEQVKLLKDLGATHVINSTDADFMAQLTDAIHETGAMLGFDPIGGGTMASQMLSAMEASASRGAAFSRYGSSTPKKVCIYGALDIGPTILNRAFGLTWDLSGWLLTPFMMKAGMEVVARMRARVMKDLTTTFPSHYKARVDLDGMLTKEAVSEYNARRTGEKYLVVP